MTAYVTYDDIGVTLDNLVATIEIQRPPHNFFDIALIKQIADVLEKLDADDDCRASVLCAEGKAFCAGADLKTFIPKWEDADLMAPRRNAAMGIAGGITRGRHRLTKPVIAAINGHAIGGGFELALACDIRIASDRAKFGVFEVRHGLHQGDGGLVRLVAVAGIGVALDLTLTGREVDAEEALRLRLVSQVVPADELLQAAERVARVIMANSPTAVRSAKETILDLIGRPLDDALRLETINGYSSLGDFSDARARLGRFTGK